VNPNVKAFLDMIAVSELGERLLAVSDNGYNVIVGSTPSRPILFESYADHPRRAVTLRIGEKNVRSTAAGRYQLLARYFDAYKRQLGLKDFSPAAQDAIAVQQIRERGALADIEAAIGSKQQWIFRKINEQRERSVRRLQPPMEWRDGGKLTYLGFDITMRVTDGSNAGVRYDDVQRELHLSLPAAATEQQLKDRVQGWLQSEARRVFAERLAIYAEKLGVRFKSFALSSAATQWRSCTADGRIKLNWRLMHFALPNIDYVVAHELAHLREMNHGPRFWDVVRSVIPDLEAARGTLRSELLPALERLAVGV